MKGLLGMKWAIVTCVLLLVWQLWLVPVVSSHTGVWVSTGISLMVQLAAGVALVVCYRRRWLLKWQLTAGLIGVALMAVGTALLATSAPGGSVTDVLMVMCGNVVWAALTLWVIIRAIVRPTAPLPAS